MIPKADFNMLIINPFKPPLTEQIADRATDSERRELLSQSRFRPKWTRVLRWTERSNDGDAVL